VPAAGLFGGLSSCLFSWGHFPQNRDEIVIPVYPTKLPSAGQLNRDDIKTHLRVNLPHPQLGNGQPVICTLTSTAHNLGALNFVKAVLQSAVEPGLKSVEECHTRITHNVLAQARRANGVRLLTDLETVTNSETTEYVMMCGAFHMRVMSD